MIKRLLDRFQPAHYRLKLDIDSENSTFSGRAAITGQLIKSTNEVALHAKELTINSASINGTPATVSEGEFDVLTLQAESELPAGEVLVKIEFSGDITDAMHGMYPCYFEHEGKRKKLIATQFESHHAREVFPCVDEPAAKAAFDVELVTAEGETVLSNMPIASQKVVSPESSVRSGSEKLNTKDQKLRTTFETTPVMSTYLLAFVCGEMVSREAKTKDGVVVKSWASAAQDPAWLDFSLQEAVSYIEFYNDYFNVPYPLAKCDQVALPDFESGAMENWGLITYRETAMLSDPENISLSTQQLVAIVVAHELSHQWFGNLVTMQWWDDLWLNESFASMMEYIAVDSVHPEWKMWEEYVSQDAVIATNRDVYSDVQPVRVAVNNPEEIHTLFDPAIVYAKGGKLLKGLRDMLGDDAWRRGLKAYFETHAYKNTTRDDLWEALGNASEIAVQELMDQWIEHPGQPLITAAQRGNSVVLSQQRLLLDKAQDKAVWQVPLLAKGLPPLLTTQAQTIKLETENYALLNSSGVGHYVVNYTEAEHKAWLAEQLADPNQPSEWKIARLNELVMLARHGDTALSEALETIKNSSSEPRAAVWSQIANILGNSRQIIEGDEAAEASLRQLSFDLAKPHFERLGWEYTADEPSNDTHLRTTIIGLAIASEDAAVINQALERYRAAKTPEDLPAELRSALMGVAVRFGKPEDFDALIKLYKASKNADFRSDITAALCSTKQPEQAKQLTELLLDTQIVRTQDTIRWYVYLLRNRYVRQVAWDWLVENWPWVLKTFGGSKSYDDFARYSASFFNTEAWLKAYADFFEPKQSDPALKRAISIGLEEIKAKSAWRSRDLQPVTDWLTKYSAKSS